MARECSRPVVATPMRGQGPTKQDPELDQGPGSVTQPGRSRGGASACGHVHRPRGSGCGL